MRCKSIVTGEILGAALVAITAASVPASASTYTVLDSFCHRGSQFTCPDGKDPAGNLVADGEGNLFGTTSAGGATNNGVIFEMVRKRGGKYAYRVLHDFDGNAEGGTPATSMILDTSGNLYGTAVSGGSNFGGTAFELSPNADRSAWTYKVIQNFCTQVKPDCVKGSVPQSPLTYAGAAAGLAYDGTSPLYGTTLLGPQSPGIVYKLTSNGDGTYTGSTVYNFCAEAGCADGSNPEGQIAIDDAGQLYGVTNGGGNENGGGVAYRIDLASGAETVLHTFCSEAACADGATPGNAGVTLDGRKLYGAASVGGANSGGAVYSLNAKNGKETVIYSFCAAQGCTDGESPVGAVLRRQGATIGAALDALANGVIYRVGASGTEEVLHAFCQEVDCTDGTAPIGVIAGPNGSFFGLTNRGGARNRGVIFQLTP